MRQWVFTLLLIALVQAQSPQWARFQGTYENQGGYGYRAAVPPGLTGHKASPPAPSHGFAIDLDPQGNSHISVTGYYNAMFYPDAKAAAEEIASDVDGTREFQPARLAGLPAMQYTARYRDNKSGLDRTRTATIALRTQPGAGMGILYEIRIDTPTPQAATHQHVYKTVLNSFRLTPLPH